jgi:hypothetical protein
MKKQRTIRNGYPLYLIAVVWVVMCFGVGVHTAAGFLATVVLSVLAYLVGHALWPDQVVEEEPAPKAEPASPEDSETAALKKERDENLAQLRRLNDRVSDDIISARIRHIEEVSGRIYQFALEHPQKRAKIRQFQNYYLPTTIKLLNTYVQLVEAGVSGENISSGKTRIENMLTTISDAFDRQLDGLYGDTAMDVSADIQVLETLLKQEGLSGEKPF